MNVRSRRFYRIVFCIFLLSPSVYSSVLKDALEEHLKDIEHNEENETFKLQKEKGEKDHHIESRLDDTHTHQNTKSSDDVKYLKKDVESKVTADKGAHGGYTTKQDKAEDSQSTGFKRGHKKGHHKQGFQNSYHKDESSNKSTFFDDFNDEGDQAGYNSKLNNHDNHYGRNYQGSHNNGQEYLRDNYHGGGHSRYGDNGVKRVAHKDYGRKHYLDNSELHDRYRAGRDYRDRGNVRERHEYSEPHVHRDPGWDWQRWDERRGWDRPQWDRRGWDYGGPGHYDDHGVRHDGYGHGPDHGYGYRYGESRDTPVAEVPRDAPVVAHRKQTITIYEDPRYSGPDEGQLRQGGDHLQLDFQPSARRYASYDDTYYSAPARTAQASQINKLVYNYKRQ
ncbi:uncharacterized protein LOC121729054 [Aricia agestis]|uniref:uncharacterized protein LOC121729054 n=1 Tax=Aricia agestis TaxID=91739 RepID=UPI001C208FFD|nr:uncharacterized protein LOC121729054 [Aricia agestis]